MNAEIFYQILLVASFVVFAAILAIYLRSGRASMFHPATIYLFIHAVTFVIRPVFVYYRHYDDIYLAYQFHPSMVDKITVVLGANLAVVVFVLAALAFGNKPPRLLGLSEVERRHYLKPLILTCAILGVPAVWSLVSNLRTAANPDNFTLILDAATGAYINTTGNGYLFEAQVMLAPLGGMFAYLNRFRWWSLLPFVAFVILRAGTGGRGPFIAAIFIISLLYLYQKRARWLTLTTSVLAVLAMTLFRTVGDDRGSAVRGALGITGHTTQVQSLRFLESMDWASLEFFEYIVYVVPKRSGTFDYFLSLTQVLTEPIPRVLWHDKPIGPPIRLFSLFDYGYPIGMTQSLPGAGWLEFGWLGIVLMCAGFAWLYGRAYNRFIGSRQSPFQVLFYCAFLSTAIVSIRDGTLITILREAMFYLAPPLLMEAIARAYGVSLVWAGTADTVALPASGLGPRERRKARAGLLSGRPEADQTPLDQRRRRRRQSMSDWRRAGSGGRSATPLSE